MELCLNGIVAIALDDARSEVRVRIRGDNQAKVHESRDDDFVVFEDALDVAQGDFALGCGAALVHAEAGGDVGFFVGGEPCGFFGEAGDTEEEDEGYSDCKCSFEDD